MRDILQRPRARRRYGEDRTGGRAVIYVDKHDPASGRAWPNALPPHLSPCRPDADKGIHQHRCSRSHADLVDGYRAWRAYEMERAEGESGAYGTELADYWRDHPERRPTLRAYLEGTGREK